MTDENVISIMPCPFRELRAGDICYFDSSIYKPEYDSTFRHLEYIWSMKREQIEIGKAHIVIGHGLVFYGNRTQEQFQLVRVDLFNKIVSGGRFSYYDNYIPPLHFDVERDDYYPLPLVKRSANYFGESVRSKLPLAGDVVMQGWGQKYIQRPITEVRLNYRTCKPNNADLFIEFNDWHGFYYHPSQEMPKRYIHSSRREFAADLKPMLRAG